MNIDERIIKTVAYFDLFDYPLTRAEMRRWLFGADAVLFSEVDTAVSNLVSAGRLKESGGMVYAPDRDGLLALRVERFLHSARKWKRARRWARIFAMIPGIELVGIGNTLAYNNAKDGSDIDFFIVTAPGAIWRSRIVCALMAAIFNLRPRAGDNRDKLCLSFFVTSDALDLSGLAKDKEFNDIYFHYWVGQMVPLAGNEKTAEAYRAGNGGLTERGVLGKSEVWRHLFAPLGWLPGNFLKHVQERHFPPVLRAAEEKKDGSVIIADNILKFHVNDRRREVYDKWVRRCEYLMPNI